MVNREDIQYRVGQQFKNPDGTIKGASFLVYIDARTAMRELDELYPKDWSFDWEYIQGEVGVHGRLTVQNRTYGDVGYPNQTKVNEMGDGSGEWLKDAVSDALKRCAVHVGIGRELYDAPFLYTSELNLAVGNRKIKGFDPLTDMGKKKIEGDIDKWFNGLSRIKMSK